MAGIVHADTIDSYLIVIPARGWRALRTFVIMEFWLSNAKGGACSSHAPLHAVKCASEARDRRAARFLEP